MSVHISAKPGAIAKHILMPGDPLRAKFIVDNYLSNAKLVSSTRNIYFFTGTYKGKKVSVGASGMGCPSIGIYSYELFTEYNADCIIRIGTCGAYTKKMKLFDLINAEYACSESTYAKTAFAWSADKFKYQGNAYDVINDTAQKMNQPLIKGAIHSSDVFYRKSKSIPAIVKKYNALAVEMESFALFSNAKFLGKSAACLLTVSDIIPTHEKISADQRERALRPMMELALNSVLKM